MRVRPAPSPPEVGKRWSWAEVLGAFAGLVARTLRPDDEREQKRLARIVTAVIALAAATLLAALDKIIGPW